MGDEVFVRSSKEVGIVNGIEFIDKFDAGIRVSTEKYFIKPKKQSIYSYNWGKWRNVDELVLFRQPINDEVLGYKTTVENDIGMLKLLVDVCLDHINLHKDVKYYTELLDTYRQEIKVLESK
jgi:hypothetical protein